MMRYLLDTSNSIYILYDHTVDWLANQILHGYLVQKKYP
jgi:hypothetical protein